jgi:hypothetical protein
VIWQYGRSDPNNPYRTFDLSDELELRYRFLLNHADINARIETWGRFKARTISTPVDSAGQALDGWFARVRDDGTLDPNYAYRHLATTYNMDRIVTPRPIEVGSVMLRKKVNVNSADENAIRDAIVAALSGGGRLADVLSGDSAQLAANLRDYVDDDDVVTAIAGPGSSGAHYYGFEQPCIYISEIAYRGVTDATGVVHTSTAIELFKPYFEDRDPQPGQWRLTIVDDGGSRHVPIVWSGTRRFHVILNEDPIAELFNDSGFSIRIRRMPSRAMGIARARTPIPRPDRSNGFAQGARISLERYVEQTDTWTTVDHTRVGTGWMAPNQGARSLQRDISPASASANSGVRSRRILQGLDMPRAITSIRMKVSSRPIRRTGR